MAQTLIIILYHLILLTAIHTLRSNYQGLTFTPTVDSTYCDTILIACHETSQCCPGRVDIQKSPIRGLGSISGNVDEVEISTVFTV